jgi:hypothetical protein
LSSTPTRPALISPNDVALERHPHARHTVFAGESVELKEPRNAPACFARVPGWYPSHRWRCDYDLEPEMVLEVPGGVVFGAAGWLGPDSEHVLRGWNSYRRSANDTLRSCGEALAEGTIMLPGTSASLLQLGWGNYYHWLLQDLPRLMAILEAVDLSRVDRFLVGPTAPFIAECVQRLGIAERRLHEVSSPAPALRCEVLVAANMPRHEAPSPRWAVDKVRELFADRGAGPLRRIYLARGNASRRRVVNETELLEGLEEHGFSSVAFDGMTIAEQATVIGGADVIVAPHGAALTNLVFAEPGTRVVEILPANNPQPFFWHLADRVGLEYQAIVGCEPALRRRHAIPMNDADVLVDMSELQRAVEAAILA